MKGSAVLAAWLKNHQSPYQGRFSETGMCLTVSDTNALAKKPALSMIVKTPLSHDFRKMVLVMVRSNLYWADRSSGALFHTGDGACLSTMQLQLLFEHAGETYDAMRAHFPKLEKKHPEPRGTKGKTGPKPKTQPAWSDSANSFNAGPDL